MAKCGMLQDFHPTNFFAAMLALWPPKPNELLMMAFTFNARAALNPGGVVGSTPSCHSCAGEYARDVNGKWSKCLPYVFMLVAALSRWPKLFPPNFRPF